MRKFLWTNYYGNLPRPVNSTVHRAGMPDVLANRSLNSAPILLSGRKAMAVRKRKAQSGQLQIVQNKLVLCRGHAHHHLPAFRLRLRLRQAFRLVLEYMDWQAIRPTHRVAEDASALNQIIRPARGL